MLSKEIVAIFLSILSKKKKKKDGDLTPHTYETVRRLFPRDQAAGASRPLSRGPWLPGKPGALPPWGGPSAAARLSLVGPGPPDAGSPHRGTGTAGGAAEAAGPAGAGRAVQHAAATASRDSRQCRVENGVRSVSALQSCPDGHSDPRRHENTAERVQGLLRRRRPPRASTRAQLLEPRRAETKRNNCDGQLEKAR